jgi:hypothetical protein
MPFMFVPVMAFVPGDGPSKLVKLKPPVVS